MANIVSGVAEAVRAKLEVARQALEGEPASLISSSPEWKALQSHVKEIEKL